MVPEDIKNEWKEEIERQIPGEGETLRQLRTLILLRQENAYYQGEKTVLEARVKYYEDMYAEDVCTCLHCLLERSEEDEDEDGMEHDGLPTDPKGIKPSKLGEEEKDRLEKMFGENTE